MGSHSNHLLKAPLHNLGKVVSPLRAPPFLHFKVERLCCRLLEVSLSPETGNLSGLLHTAVQVVHCTTPGRCHSQTAK